MVNPDVRELVHDPVKLLFMSHDNWHENELTPVFETLEIPEALREKSLYESEALKSEYVFEANEVV
jgi:hypothetical protein